MKPYQTDIRTKIIETKNQTNESTQQLADRFQVSYSFVNRLLRRYEVTKSVEPLPHGGGKPPLIYSKQLEIVKELVEEDNDATLQELSDRLKSSWLDFILGEQKWFFSSVELTLGKEDSIKLSHP